MERDHYSVLGVSRYASQQALKHAYRARIREAHPDLHPADQTCADRARRVIEAYRVLRDADTRRRYDRQLAAPTPLVTMPAYSSDGPCPLWLRRFIALLVFFVVAALCFLAVRALTDRTPVFRPDVSIITTPSRHAAPAGLADQSMCLQTTPRRL